MQYGYFRSNYDWYNSPSALNLIEIHFTARSRFRDVSTNITSLLVRGAALNLMVKIKFRAVSHSRDVGRNSSLLFPRRQKIKSELSTEERGHVTLAGG